MTRYFSVNDKVRLLGLTYAFHKEKKQWKIELNLGKYSFGLTNIKLVKNYEF